MSHETLTAHKCACPVPTLGVVDGDRDAIYCGTCEGYLGDLNDVLVQAWYWQEKRKETFATADQTTCEHSMVYNKEGDDMHCNNCDKFMYDLSKD